MIWASQAELRLGASSPGVSSSRTVVPFPHTSSTSTDNDTSWVTGATEWPTRCLPVEEHIDTKQPALQQGPGAPGCNHPSPRCMTMPLLQAYTAPDIETSSLAGDPCIGCRLRIKFSSQLFHACLLTPVQQLVQQERLASSEGPSGYNNRQWAVNAVQECL
jgi:hypothetical protein